MAEISLGREKEMTSTSRIERIANQLSGIGRNLFHGSSLMALVTMVYGGHTGLLGDLFVAAARDYTPNAAVLGFALMFLVSLWGAMLIVFAAIAGIVAVVERAKSMRRASAMPPQDPVREANIATIARWSADLDDVTIANVCDASIDALSDGYPLIAVYQASPRPDTLTVIGDVVTIEIELTVQFADRPPVTVDALLTGDVADGSPGLTNLSRITDRIA